MPFLCSIYMTEDRIIAKCIKGDRRSQNELYKRYFPLMSSIALRYVHNESDVLPAINSAFLKVLQNIEKYDKSYAFATWIRNIMVNDIIDEFRKQKKHIANIYINDYKDVKEMVDVNLAESNLGENELRKMMSELPEVSQKVFNMYAIDGFKHREIGDKLGISEGTSKWHVSNARRKIKTMLEDQKTQEENALNARR